MSWRRDNLRQCGRVVLFLCVYIFVQRCWDGSGSSWYAGPVNEIRGEFYPDAAKSAERLKEAEVVPAFNEYMQADDVTQHLNWMQEFCRRKLGMDDHLRSWWRCEISRVAVHGELEEVPEVHATGGMNCSRAWVHKHIVIGDDPRKVPWKSMQLTPRIDEMHDEVNHGGEQLDSLGEKLEDLEGKVDELLKFERGVAKEVETTTRHVLRENGGRAAVVRPSRKVRARAQTLAQDTARHTDLPEGWHRACNTSTKEDGSVEELRPVCRNHHWGLVHLCQPREISFNLIILKFPLDRIGTQRVVDWTEEDLASDAKAHDFFSWDSDGQVFIKVQLDFVMAEPKTGWYKANIEFFTGENVGSKTVIDLFYILVFLLLYIFLFFADLVRCTFALPTTLSNIRRVRSGETTGEGTQPIENQLSDILYAGLDPAGKRQFMMLPSLVLELVIALVIFGAIASSTVEVTIELLRHSREYRLPELHYLPWYHQFTELAYLMVFRELNDFGTHQFCVGIVAVRVFESLLYVREVRYIPLTFMRSMMKLVWFMCAFFFILVVCGCMFSLSFGGQFMQFRTSERAAYVLFLAAVGSPDLMMADVHTYEETNAFRLTCWIGVYMALIVILFMNVFISIVLDAYARVNAEMEEDEEFQAEARTFGIGTLAWLCRVNLTSGDDAEKEKGVDGILSVFFAPE